MACNCGGKRKQVITSAQAEAQRQRAVAEAEAMVVAEEQRIAAAARERVEQPVRLAEAMRQAQQR